MGKLSRKGSVRWSNGQKQRGLTCPTKVGNFLGLRLNMRKAHTRITTTIEREWLAQIIAGTKILPD